MIYCECLSPHCNLVIDVIPNKARLTKGDKCKLTIVFVHSVKISYVIVPIFRGSVTHEN